MYADLHLHSTFSDGTDTPIELYHIAQQNNLKVISITDHDSVEGVKDFYKSNMQRSIRIISGIEVSTVCNRRYLHVLGYYININDTSLAAFIKTISEEKKENTRINFENALSQGCFSYKWDRVLELNRNQPRISGVHVVEAMQYDNYKIENIDLWEMFHKYFWAESVDFIETETMTAYDAIDIIKKSGGIPIIAHPKSIGDDEIVLKLVDYGAQGLEVFHPIHTSRDVQRYWQIASKKKLYISGGSDWHGKNNGTDITHMGMTGLENENFEILKYI